MSSPNSYVYSAPNLGIPSIISDSSDSAAFRLLYIRKKYACFPYGSRLHFPEIRTIMWQIHHFLIFEDGTPWSISYVVEQLHIPSQHLWPRRPLKSPDAPAWRP